MSRVGYDNSPRLLNVAVTSRALFDLEESHALYEREGVQAYADYQRTLVYDKEHGNAAQQGGRLSKTNTRTLSLFMEDKLKLGPRWSLVGGLRWDRIDVDRTGLRNASGPDFEKTFTHASGRLGAVFAVTPELSLYGQYATAADPLTGVVNTTAQ